MTGLGFELKSVGRWTSCSYVIVRPFTAPVGTWARALYQAHLSWNLLRLREREGKGERERETGKEGEREITAPTGSFILFSGDYEGRTLRGEKEAGSRQTPNFLKIGYFSQSGVDLFGAGTGRDRESRIGFGGISGRNTSETLPNPQPNDFKFRIG